MPASSERSTLRPRIGLFTGFALLLACLVFAPPAGLSPAGWRTAGVGLLMAVWWMSEAVPIAVTSLVPLLAFPLLGIAKADAAAAPYANPLIFLFLGGFLIALAMQRWGLHRRIALAIIRGVGTRPTRIIAGFMLASAFLSMWISNTATAMMMLPIGLSVVELVVKGGDPRGAAGGGGALPAKGTPGGHFALDLMLGIAYASSIGGLATLIGSPPNALLAAFMDKTYGVEVGFLEWMSVGLPLAIVGLAGAFLVLTRFAYPVRLREIPGGAELLRREVERMGPISKQERRVAVVFTLTAALWITRPLVARLLPGLTDTGVAIFGALLLFLLPADWSEGEALLDWPSARKVPWGVLLLFGGGLSLAGAVAGTGLAGWIGERMHGAAAWPVVLIAALTVTVIVLLTELTSNTATAATFLPVVGSVAVGLGEAPLFLVLPAALAASCAFMMPVATPPNAIVYGSGYVTIPQMVQAGIWLNLLFIVLLTAAAFTLIPWAASWS